MGATLWDLCRGDLSQGKIQAGSLAGAAHLLNNNAGVLRVAQVGQKPTVDHKGKCYLDFNLQYGLKR
jgi:hypothetical protein